MKLKWCHTSYTSVQCVSFSSRKGPWNILENLWIKILTECLVSIFQLSIISFTARTFSETWKRQRGQNYGSIKSSWICLPLNRKQNCVDFIFQFTYRLSCTHFLYNLTLCTLIVIVMVYWFKLVALISSRAAPAQSLTVTPSVVEWVKFSRNLQQITLLRPRALCSAAPCWLVCESMHHQFTNVHSDQRNYF